MEDVSMQVDMWIANEHMQCWSTSLATSCMLSCFSHVRLFATLCSLLGSSILGILQARIPARILRWVGLPSSRDLPDPGIEPMSLISNLHWQASSLSLAPHGKPH